MTFGEWESEVTCDGGGRWCGWDNVPRTTGSRDVDADVDKCKLDIRCDQMVSFWISRFSNRS